MIFDKSILEDLQNTIFDKTYIVNGATVHVVAPKDVTDEEKQSILAQVKKINIEIVKGITEVAS